MSEKGSNTGSAQTGFASAQSENAKEFQYKADMEMGSIATKAEYDHRVNSRPTPELEPHLTPDDGTQAPVDHAVNRDNEVRIQQLRNSLLNAQERLRKDRGLASVRGRVQHDFDHTD
jgi:hypothetical protein